MSITPPAALVKDIPPAPSYGTSPLAELPAIPEIQEQPTPFLAIDLEAAEKNIARMQSFFETRKAHLRPHVKAHKSTFIARLQDAGQGVTCSTTDEVVAMAAAGINDILLANIVAHPIRASSLATAASRAQVTVAIDSIEIARLFDHVADAFGVQFGVVIEYDIGMRRNGVLSTDEGVRLADQIAKMKNLLLRGVMAYEGHLIAIEDRAERARRAMEAFDRVGEFASKLRDCGFEVAIITGGSTATYDSTGTSPWITEVQAGTYVLMDATYSRLTPEFHPAVAMIATVTTSRSNGEIVADVGSKRLALDWGYPALAGYDAVHLGTSEEHTMFRLTEGHIPRVGEPIAIIPAHVCSTMAIHQSAVACRSGAVEDIIEIDARDPLS